MAVVPMDVAGRLNPNALNPKPETLLQLHPKLNLDPQNQARNNHEPPPLSPKLSAKEDLAMVLNALADAGSEPYAGFDTGCWVRIQGLSVGTNCGFRAQG